MIKLFWTTSLCRKDRKSVGVSNVQSEAGSCFKKLWLFFTNNQLKFLLSGFWVYFFKHFEFGFEIILRFILVQLFHCNSNQWPNIGGVPLSPLSVPMFICVDVALSFVFLVSYHADRELFFSWCHTLIS